MVFLGARAVGRDNNLNLIRMLAATGVLVSHAVPISQGPEAVEPLKDLTGYSLGTLCVMVFFAISGFLITASFERSSSRRSFLLARTLRLMPGLVCNLVFVAFVLGVIATTLSAWRYLAAPEPYLFVLRNLTLFPLAYELPGVFDDQPYKAIVGSIWTLRHEVLCYAGVFLVGIVGAWHSRQRAVTVLVLYAVAWVALTVFQDRLPVLAQQFVRLSLPFYVGVVFYVFRAHLPLSWAGAVASLILAWASFGTGLYSVAMSLAIGYVTFWLAYVPRYDWLLSYNRLGDYSYGTYLYAFPLQGMAVFAFGPQSALENIVYSFPPTLLLAILSWHAVEAPAMQSKAALLRRLRPA